MSIETDVTQDRNRGIGGSDIPAIMGDSPFMTRWDLLQYKVGIKVNEFSGNEYTRYGQMIEPKIRQFVNESCNSNFQPDYIEEDADTPISYFYHSDGNDESRKTLLEIKSTSRIARQFDAMEIGIDFREYALKFYKHYLEQLLYGMWLHGYQKGILAVYERPSDKDETFDSSRLQVFEINRDDHETLLAAIRDALIEFKADWRYLDEHRDIEESELPSRYTVMATVDKAIEIGGLTIPVRWLLQNEKPITAALKSTKEELCKQMGEHNISAVIFNDLGIKMSYVAKGEDKTVCKFNEKAFEKENNALYQKYLQESVQKGKSAYVRITSMAEGENA